MPIVVKPLQKRDLIEILDQRGMTLELREIQDGWGAYIIDLQGTEYGLFDEWGITCEDTAQETLNRLAEEMSHQELELGPHTFEHEQTAIAPGELP